MKIILINKFYYLKGGSERHVFALSDLLRRSGHTVIPFSMADKNNEATPYGRYFSKPVGLEKFNLKNIFKLFYNREAAKKLEKLIKAERPDIAHLHNISHQLSSSIIDVLKKYNIPIVQTLHDYKLICPNYKLFSGGRACYKCRGGKYYNCVFNRCVKNSYLKSLLAALEAYYTKYKRAYEKINLFIAPSRFMKDVCVSFGVSENKIKVLNNFTNKFFIAESESAREPYLLYYGRLAEEKGIEILVQAMALTEQKIKLLIIGAGPDFKKIKNLIEKLKLGDRIEMLGPKYGDDLNKYIINSRAVAVPSIWPENFPYVVLEAMSAGKPVIASAIGGLKEMINEGENGFLFKPGDVKGMALAIDKLFRADQEKLSQAALLSSEKYRPDNYLAEIMKIYQALLNKNYVKNNFKKYIAAVFLLFYLFTPLVVRAYYFKDSFPKIANYYLQPIIPNQHISELSKYDLIVLDAEAPEINSGILSDIKAANKNGKIFAYVPSQSVNTQGIGDWSEFREKNYQAADSGNWWLKDSKNNIISFNQTWPTIKIVDAGSDWKNYLPDFVSREVLPNNNWDGIFYDMVSPGLSWLNNGDIVTADKKLNGKTNMAVLNQYWAKNMNELLANTKKKISPLPLIANLDVAGTYTNNLDGEMMENFPSKWLGANGWSKLMSVYLKNNNENYTYIINANSNNNNQANNYQNMRFGLTSTLLGDGYFSYDQGDQNHAQVWWYDEFNVKLGRAESKAYNLLDPNNSAVKIGLWRRDFENGIVINNSTSAEQTYVFSKEEFEKIKGVQDAKVNSGQKINYFKLKPNDGFIALKIQKEIENSAYINGGFVRVFNSAGAQVRNGFFSYRNYMPSGVKILVSDINNDGRKETLVDGNGKISAQRNGKIIFSFSPFAAFKPEVNFTVAKLNKAKAEKQIIAGAGTGGGPQIRIFDHNGRLLSGGFFAFDKNFRGGVNVAAGDINGDGQDEIIAGAGTGGGPQIRIFDHNGRLLSGGFFAFDKNFRGGVNVAAGDINGDGQDEIIAGAGTGGGPQIRIFNGQGKLIGQFFAADTKNRQGAYAAVYDINNDKVDEILVRVNILN
ncbi:MAG: glycosyltransferase [Patescibacteria group bacterium]|nr:glycosyltransferase [Patescibacteria group bacterium]